MNVLRTRSLVAAMGATAVAASLLGAMQAAALASPQSGYSTQESDDDGDDGDDGDDDSDQVFTCDDSGGDQTDHALSVAVEHVTTTAAASARAGRAERRAHRMADHAARYGTRSQAHSAEQAYRAAHRGAVAAQRAARVARHAAAVARAAAASSTQQNNCILQPPTPPTPTTPTTPTTPPTPPTPTTPGVLDAPTGLAANSASYLSNGAFRLTWNSVPGATTYEVQRGGVAIGTTAATSFTPGSTTANARGAYTVVASNGALVSAPSAQISAGRFVGDAVADKRGVITYGTIQVSLAVTGTRVTGCWASYPTSSDSGPINSSAIPRLCSEAIAAQSATIASVSGASATSPAFKSSLQSALTRAGI